MTYFEERTSRRMCSDGKERLEAIWRLRAGQEKGGEEGRRGRARKRP